MYSYRHGMLSSRGSRAVRYPMGLRCRETMSISLPLFMNPVSQFLSSGVGPRPLAISSMTWTESQSGWMLTSVQLSLRVMSTGDMCGAYTSCVSR